jgi:hypothetical protein
VVAVVAASEHVRARTLHQLHGGFLADKKEKHRGVVLSWHGVFHGTIYGFLHDLHRHNKVAGNGACRLVSMLNLGKPVEVVQGKATESLLPSLKRFPDNEVPLCLMLSFPSLSSISITHYLFALRACVLCCCGC